MTSVLKRIQVGKETTNGTLVAADTILLGTGLALKPSSRPSLVEDDIAYRSAGLRHRTDTILVKDTLRFPNAYFQLLPLLFSCGLIGSVSPTEQNNPQADWLWVFTPSETATNSLDSMTLEVGDENQEYETGYVMIEKYKISGNVSQDGGVSAVALEVDFFGKQWVASTFTGALSIPSNELINAKMARLYSDTSWAGVGGTELAGILRRFEVEIIPGVKPDSSGSADKLLTGHSEGNLRCMISLTLQRGSASDAMWDDLATGDVLRVIRLAITGGQIGSGDNHNLTIDIGGEIKEVIPMADGDLDTIVIEGRLDPTGAKQLALTVTTNVATI